MEASRLLLHSDFFNMYCITVHIVYFTNSKFKYQQYISLHGNCKIMQKKDKLTIVLSTVLPLYQ